MSDRVEKCRLRWFGKEERMVEERIAKKIYDAEIIGRDRGRPTRV